MLFRRHLEESKYAKYILSSSDVKKCNGTKSEPNPCSTPEVASYIILAYWAGIITMYMLVNW